MLSVDKPIAVDLFCATYKTHPAEYRAWSGMWTRCTNQKFVDWLRYGGRGIKVCPPWKSFAVFFAEIGPKPTARHSLDRINSDGDYERSNCRWATPSEQANNWAQRNKRLTLDGVTRTETEWARLIGISRESLRGRLACGWPLVRALTTPAIRKRKRDGAGQYVNE